MNAIDCNTKSSKIDYLTQIVCVMCVRVRVYSIF